jgi:hypothetical protein
MEFVFESASYKHNVVIYEYLRTNIVFLFQHRITKLAPREQSEEDLSNLFEKSLTVF